jgi:hypothetical protein
MIFASVGNSYCNHNKGFVTDHIQDAPKARVYIDVNKLETNKLVVMNLSQLRGGAWGMYTS